MAIKFVDDRPLPKAKEDRRDVAIARERLKEIAEGGEVVSGEELKARLAGEGEPPPVKRKRGRPPKVRDPNAPPPEPKVAKRSRAARKAAATRKRMKKARAK